MTTEKILQPGKRTSLMIRIAAQYLFDMIGIYKLEYLTYHYLKVYRKRKDIYKQPNKCLLSVIIVTHNSAHCLDKALWLFENNKLNKEVEIIIIDNNSGDRSYLKKYEKRKNYQVVYNKKNFMFTLAVNQGISIANGGYVLLLNPDVSWEQKLKGDPINKMIEVIEFDEKIGIVGLLQKQLKSNKASSYEGFIHNRISRKPISTKDVFVRWRKLYKSTHPNNEEVSLKHNQNKPTMWVRGSIFIIKRDLINDIGFLPYNKTCKHYFSEIIYCQIARYNGWKVLAVGQSYAYHDCGRSGE